MKNHLYPLKFHPILKEKIWGGTKLKTFLNKESDAKNIGESWEISDVDGDASVVSNGELKGATLKQLLSAYQEELIGKKNFDAFGEKFPLLIKFIDAKEDLSIQLHPNDKLAAKRHNSFGKTEMWYVMHADDDANLIVGFNKKITPEVYLKHLEGKTLTKILNFEHVKEGDTYFIEVGRVHAIGAGVMLAEIQQTSDITYRVYDWDRTDDEGNERELHNDLAIDAIDFDMDDDFKVPYSTQKNQSNKMVSCPYFTTNFLHLTQTIKKENYHDSFMIYMCVDGEININIEGFSDTIKKGETMLLPAVLKHFEIEANNAKLLEVYV
ncbi:class I mannose-6-phosphate isomerase [Flavobacteriaceae bacterium S0825]|uniref:type I phosphomannose isomerase catalytic subunit n=1 Tax=Gaetbulibacter sp. S0825 TaxID=2720084 RepID=UPI00142FAA0B|nr:type I phosphomannose isomerase catalytic subunit [Gaetbulibacter sp. S0825]MCK0110208.1 class I mannose-6-phosphate isomerase [Flavobacteriaceae bacterium S0825]NIX65837.1 mannose-6-phosphate isomerase [Gaetbulibacter sp. S0825]